MHLVSRLARRLVTLLAIGLVSIFGGRTLSAQSPSAPGDGLTSGPLFDALARMDSILFDASFGSCDAAKANAIFAADVEVRDRHRFEHKPLVVTGVKTAINDPAGLLRIKGIKANGS